MRKKLLGSLVAIGIATTPVTANAGIIWPGDIFTTTTTVGGVIAVVVWMVTKKKPEEGGEVKDEATKAAFLYLKQSHLQLAQDLGEGQGPVIDDLAAGVGIRPENKEVFAARLTEHAPELLELSNPETLDEARTLQFVERLVEIIKADPALAADLQAA